MSNLKLIFLLCFFIIVFTLTGWSETKLVIATNELPPFVSSDQDESFLTDLLMEIGREIGVTFDFQFMPWKRCEIMVDELKAWGAIPYVPTPEREQKYYFSDRLYLRQSKFFLYNSDGIKKQIVFNSLSDLKSYRIGGVLGYYYEKQFSEAGLTVDYVKSEEQNFKKLAVGRVDMIPADQTTGWYLVKKLFPSSDYKNFFVLDKPFNESGNFLITSKKYKDSQKLLINFNSALEKIKNNGVYQKIVKKHNITMIY